MKFWVKCVAEDSEYCECGRTIERGERFWVRLQTVLTDPGANAFTVIVQDYQVAGSVRCSGCMKREFPDKSEE